MSEQPKKRGPGRPPKPKRELRRWGHSDHEEFMKMYRAFQTAHNRKSIEEVDRWADALFDFINRSRGV